jgi:plasmid stabilization system protein ParE
MSSYQLSAAARLDLLQIWNYLADSVSISVADRVVADLRAAVRKLAASPFLGHIRSDLTNRPALFYRVHSYFIIYDPKSKPLYVIRVLHSARDIESLLQ